MKIGTKAAPLHISIGGRTATDVEQDVRDKIKTGQAVICPICTQHAFLNSRKITATMARQLLHLYRGGATAAKDLQLSTDGCERMYSLLRFWDLIVKTDDDADTWEITEAGRAFVQGRTTAAKYAFVFNNQCLARSQDQVTFSAAFKSPFSLPEVFDTPAHLDTIT